tara:strand:+ start:751 stop:1044 length:294 start_codon:yes stop_codon:yes gene_type:complete
MGSQSKKTMKSLNREIAHDFKDYNKDLLANLKDLTPVGDSRNAQRGWKNKYNNEIGKKRKYNLVENKVPYIGVLDAGSSTQAPNGIVKPALDKTKQG